MPRHNDDFGRIDSMPVAPDYAWRGGHEELLVSTGRCTSCGSVLCCGPGFCSLEQLAVDHPYGWRIT